MPTYHQLEIARRAHFLGHRMTQLSLRILIWVAIANVNLWVLFGILSLTGVVPFFDMLQVELFDWILLVIFWLVVVWGLWELTRWQRRSLYILGAALILYQVLTLFAFSPLFGAGGWASFILGFILLLILGRTSGYLLE